MRSQPLDESRSRIFKAAGEAGTIELRNATMPLPGDVQRRTFPLLTPEERRMSVREKVTAIGRQDPSKASLISQKLLLYRGTAGEREECEGFGIPVPDMQLQGALPGGMREEKEAAGLVDADVEAIEAWMTEGVRSEKSEEIARHAKRLLRQAPSALEEEVGNVLLRLQTIPTPENAKRIKSPSLYLLLLDVIMAYFDRAMILEDRTGVVTAETRENYRQVLGKSPRRS